MYAKVKKEKEPGLNFLSVHLSLTKKQHKAREAKKRERRAPQDIQCLYAHPERSSWAKKEDDSSVERRKVSQKRKRINCALCSLKVPYLCVCLQNIPRSFTACRKFGARALTTILYTYALYSKRKRKILPCFIGNCIPLGTRSTSSTLAAGISISYLKSCAEFNCPCIVYGFSSARICETDLIPHRSPNNVFIWSKSNILFTQFGQLYLLKNLKFCMQNGNL